MNKENEAILHRWIDDVWNKNNQKTIEELFDEDGTAVCPINPADKPIRGIESFKNFLSQTRKVFSDIQIVIEQSFAENERVVALCHFKANRRKLDSDGTVHIIPVSVSGLCQIIIKDGKIFHTWNNLDLLSVL